LAGEGTGLAVEVGVTGDVVTATAVVVGLVVAGAVVAGVVGAVAAGDVVASPPHPTNSIRAIIIETSDRPKEVRIRFDFLF